MLTVALYLVLALAVGGVLFFVSVAIFGGASSDAGTPELDSPGAARSDLVLVSADRAPLGLPQDRAMRPDDVDGLRLPVALRGYRMAETDETLDRLAHELRERDAELAQLRDQLARQTPRPENTESGG